MSTEESTLSVVAGESVQTAPEEASTALVSLWLLDVGLLVIVVLAVAIVALDALG